MRTPILIIDDEADFLKLVNYNLRLAGFKVYAATTGRKGLKIARKKQLEVILLDTTMPEMDGLEVLSELKYDQKTANIPVFMLTAKTLMGEIDRAFEIGADDYITKPVDLWRLGEIVKKKLNKLAFRRAQDQGFESWDEPEKDR